MKTDAERIERLRTQLVEMVAKDLTPVAQRYGYAEAPLEDDVKWRPLVLILGNYSSGKSTLINEMLGAQIQATGQAPTDDSFTVLTYATNAGEDASASADVAVQEEREGSVLLNDPRYPFARLKRHGQRFASHFRLKTVRSDFLRHLAIIDTPGMLDSVAERDRGYDYQQVIGDLSEIADLILVLFDPHKAGTIRETYASLRETLPARTFEDRVLFVLNRVDECENLTDLLRVYGTLCWNLSQMLGRKDIPQIRLTYAPRQDAGPEFLRYLPNEREALIRQIAQAPGYRLDHLATFAETHGERLSHLLEGLIAYRRARLRQIFKWSLAGFAVAIAVGAGLGLSLLNQGHEAAAWAGAGALLLTLLLWLFLTLPLGLRLWHQRILNHGLDELTPLETQARRETWAAARPLVESYLKKTGGRFSSKSIRHEWTAAKRVYAEGVRAVRAAIGAPGAP